MPKVTLDMNTFKALASDTRLDILRTLDGKKMSLNDISKATKLNKATLHEHLAKLNEVGLVKKKEREGHKWVYYKLTWKGEGLLHPENTRIVVLFTTTFLTLFFGIVMLVNYVKGYVIGKAVNYLGTGSTLLYEAEPAGIGDILIPQAMQKFSDSALVSVPLANQTNSQLSQVLVDELELKGTVGNTISPLDISWESDSVYSYIATEDVFGKGNAVAGDEMANAASNVPASMVAIVHDPALQYIAIGCIVIFSILLSIGIWKLWKNRKPKF